MMETESTIKITPPGKIIIYSHGPVHSSVCADKLMKMDEVLKQANELSPTGIESKWTLSKENHFATGLPNPCQCELDTNRIHYLLEC